MPISTDSRTRRHGVIRSVIRRRKVRSQAELGSTLAASGLEVNQSTLCRDLRELGIEKVEGVYRLPTAREREAALAAASEDPPTPGRRVIVRFVTGAIPAGPHLVVLRCAVGTASAVGLAVDAEGWTEVLGTVAGDDTLFLAVGSRRDQQVVLMRLRKIAGTAIGGEE